MLRDLELTGEILLGIAIVVPLFLLWAAVFIDLFRRKDISVFKKALWGTLVIFSTVIGVLIYFVFRPVPQPAGKRKHAHEDRSSAIVARIEQLHESYNEGAITDIEYLDKKRELLGLGVESS